MQVCRAGWGVSGAIFCPTFLRFWMADEDYSPFKKSLIYRPTTAELSMEHKFCPENALGHHCVMELRHHKVGRDC